MTERCRTDKEGPTGAVILLHGLGASSDDLAFVAESLPGENRLQFIFPQAPLRPVAINGGMVMPAWFDIHSLDGDGDEDHQGLAEAQNTVETLSSELARNGIPENRIVVGGFSQGGAVALHCLCRRPQSLAGAFALSGCLPRGETPMLQDAAAAAPVLMAHGTLDPVIPVEYGRRSCMQLQQAGFNVEWREYPRLEHSIDESVINDLSAWLARVLP